MEHTRDDGEVLGELREADGGWVAIDRLGRQVVGPVDYDDAERALDELGLRYLADRWELLLDDGATIPAVFVEVRPDRVRVKQDFGGAIDAPQVLYDLPNPIPDRLRPR